MLRLNLLALLLSLGMLTPSHAQSALERLERRLDGPAGGAAQAEEPGYLGLVADDREENGRGVRVIEVIADSPASAGGLLEGDLIISINSKPVRQMSDMAGVVSIAPAGAALTFTVLRDNETRNQRVVLGQRPQREKRRFADFGRIGQEPGGDQPLPAQPPQVPQSGASAARPTLGVIGRAVDADLARLLRIPGGGGVYVAQVLEGSVAAQAGLREGDVIVALDSEVITSPDDLAVRLQATAGRQVELPYNRRGQVQPTQVQLTGPTNNFDNNPPQPMPPAAITQEPLPEPNNPAAENEVDRITQLERQIELLQQRIRELEAKVRE